MDTLDKQMNIIDGKAVFGMIGTAFSGLLVLFNDLLLWLQGFPKSETITALIPLIPAIPTAIYMAIRAYNAYHDGKLRRDKND